MLLIIIQSEKCFQAQRIGSILTGGFQERFSDMAIAGLGIVTILPTERTECDLVGGVNQWKSTVLGEEDTLSWVTNTRDVYG